MPLGTEILPAIVEAIKVAGFVAGKVEGAEAVNIYIDRAALVHQLFDPDTAKADDAYAKLYADIQMLCAKKGITPSVYYAGAPVLKVPLANLKELMDAATKQ